MPYCLEMLVPSARIVMDAEETFRRRLVSIGNSGIAHGDRATNAAARYSPTLPLHHWTGIGVSLSLLMLPPHPAAEGAVPLAPGMGGFPGACTGTRAAVVASICVLVSFGLLLWVRKAANVYYQVASGGVCFAARRGAVAARGLAVGALLGLLPSLALCHWLGPLSAGGMPLVLGFLIGTTVYSQWIMRHWNALDNCRDCHEVRRRLHALHMAGIILGLLLIAVLLSIAWPTP